MPPKAELVWERKFLGFRLDRQGRIGIAPESIERFKQEVREMWRANQSRTSNQLRDDWKSYAKGWWGYYRLAEVRKPFTRLAGWIRRHIRKCFRIRWHSAIGRERVTTAGCSCPDAQDCADGPGRVEDCGNPDHANGAAEPDATSVRLSCTIGSCKDVANCWVQPPDAENRTSGGVGG